MLIKTLPVFCDLNREKEITAYLQETGEQLINSINADIYSFAEISRTYGSRADLFQFHKVAKEQAELQELSLDTAKTPLSVDVMVNDSGVSYQVEYRSDLYEERTIAGFVDCLHTVVEEFQRKKQIKETGT